MAITFTDWEHSDDASNSVISWADANAIRHYPLYIHAEALRQAAVERVKAMIDLDIVPSYYPTEYNAYVRLAAQDWSVGSLPLNDSGHFRYSAAAGKRIHRIDILINLLISEANASYGFVNHLDNSGAWDHELAMAPYWTESTALAAIGDATRIYLEDDSSFPSEWVVQAKKILDLCSWTRKKLIHTWGDLVPEWYGWLFEPRQIDLDDPDNVVAQLHSSQVSNIGGSIPSWLTKMGLTGAMTYPNAAACIAGRGAFLTDIAANVATWINSQTKDVHTGGGANGWLRARHCEAVSFFGVAGKHYRRAWQSSYKYVVTNPCDHPFDTNIYIGAWTPVASGFYYSAPHNFFYPIGDWDQEGYHLWVSPNIAASASHTTNHVLPSVYQDFPIDPVVHADNEGYPTPWAGFSTANVGCEIINSYFVQKHNVPGGFTFQT